jgi:hypothetical protein
MGASQKMYKIACYCLGGASRGLCVCTTSSLPRRVRSARPSSAGGVSTFLFGGSTTTSAQVSGKPASKDITQNGSMAASRSQHNSLKKNYLHEARRAREMLEKEKEIDRYVCLHPGARLGRFLCQTLTNLGNLGSSELHVCAQTPLQISA